MDSEDKDARSEISYGKGFISGQVASDRVCFSAGDDHCMNNFNFLAVDNGDDLDRDKFSGIIGLSPNKVGAKGLQGFLSQVVTFKVVKPVFSFYLTKKGQDGSKITFNGYDVQKFAKNGLTEKDISWISIATENPSYWSIPLSEQSIRFGKSNST
jgi:hypothetical protein